MALKLNLHDLQFVLRQIYIAEAHANGAALTEIRLDPAGNVITDPGAYDPVTGAYLGNPAAARAIPDAKTPFGLRTVDGSYNNLVPGREMWGAADQPMPRLLDPNWRDDADGDNFDVNGPTQPGGEVTNTDYGTPGNVADKDPRLISNLIVDMGVNNPAAIVAALTYAGSEDVEADLARLLDARITQAEADQAVVDAQTAVDDATTAFLDALQTYGNDPSTLPALLDAAGALRDAEIALSDAQAVAADPTAHFFEVAAELGLEFSENGSLVIPNVAPDEGLSAPFNSWMTFFGQFFDHGLDLISKGGNGTIYIPLQPDDPLIAGADGIVGTSDDLAPHLRFMVLTRATPVDENGNPGGQEARNVTTPFVDQNQTYTSHPSHQVFLREYTSDGNGNTVATGNLLGGQNGGLATWADVKAQAAEYLGIALSDKDVGSVPLIRTDAYGRFIPDANGFAQIIINIGADGIPNTADDVTVSGTSTSPIDTWAVGAVRTNTAFLDDIAHNAAPVVDVNGNLVPDADSNTGNAVATNPFSGQRLEYDNELLDRHFITGDGRGNENIGLSAVHHVFHAEHNRQVEITKYTILTDGDLAFVNEWLKLDLTQTQLDNIKLGLETNTNKAAYISGLNLDWDGERLFQTARFATEMQYQHLVFEEFARKVQPNIDPFVFNSVTDINPAIFAEFAHVVYRFGHSMLSESVDRIYDDNTDESLSLIDAFLNPVLYDNDGSLSAEEAAGAVARGMTRQHGNEIDEFIVNALRNNLLGLPLDLAAINIARGRDTGMPSLNEARAQLYAATGSTFLEPYSSWIDFAANLKTPASIINFIAAYGTHATITSATTLEGKRAAAFDLVFGGTGAPADRDDFLLGRDAYADNKGGLNLIDLWIGGLAEKKMPFGGMLGSTFNAVFELQLENLQDADRFYYLTRTQGLNFLNELEQNAFSKIIMANTSLTDPGPDGIRGTEDDIVNQHLGIDSFALYEYMFEVDQSKQIGPDPTGGIDPWLAALGFSQVNRAHPAGDASHPYDNYFRYIGGEHVSIGGTAQNDWIIGDAGDDSIWGGAGNDRIEGGAGVDLINGGPGDDIITDSGDTGDFLKGEEGDDVIANSNGLDVIMGGPGKDVIFVGVDDTEVFGGSGDDFILGGDAVDFLMGNEGDDWIEGGGGFDTIAGDNSELFFNSRIIGHDVMFAGSDEQDFDAESGDDIMVQGESVIRNEGMFGFDWAIFKGVHRDAFANMNIRIFTTEEEDILRNRFDKVEALSGWDYNDTLIGDDREFGAFPDIATVNNTENIFFRDELDLAGIARINGLDQIITPELLRFEVYGADFSDTVQWIFTGGNILLGGGGSDTIHGRGGDDVIDGDRWLNVRIRITEPGQENTEANEISTIDSLKHVFTLQDAADPSWIGKSLFELMIDRVIVPSQLHIVREILDGGQAGDVDTAVFWDLRENYEITFNTNGSVTVEHVGFDDDNVPDGTNLISDGRDTLYNIERLQFQDMVVTISHGTTNTPPQAINGNETVAPGIAFLGQVVAVDAETPSNELSFSLFTDVTNGTLVFNANGSYTYTPDAGFTGPDSFQFIASDGLANSNVGTINLTVEATNQAPVISTAAESFTVAMNGFLIDTLLGGTDPDGDDLTFIIVFGSEVGGLAFIIDPEAGEFAFLPDLDHVGAASFQYYIWDGELSSDIKTVSITVGSAPPVNQSPTDISLAGNAVNEFAANGTLVGTLSTADPDVGDSHTYTLIDDAGGIFTIVGNQIRVADGLLLDFEQLASHQVTVQSSDGTASIQRTFTINLNNVDPENVVGDARSNTFVGGPGNDRFDGGAGADILIGGLGNDIYYVDNSADQVIELDGQGTDTIFASASYTLAPGSAIEIVRANAGATALTLTGNEFNNNFYSGDGADVMAGRGGNDYYFVNNAADRVIEAIGEGTDVVYASVSYSLEAGSEVEILRANAGTTGITLTGNAFNNRFYSGAGNDTLRGLGGHDVYFVNNAGDRVLENIGEGTDTIYALVSYTLEAGSEVEIIRAHAGAVSLVLTGNEFAQRFYSGDGNDIMGGLGGNDVYFVNSAGDRVLESVGQGTDTIYTSVSFSLEVGSEVEIIRANAGATGLTLTGNAFNNRFYSGAGNDVMSGLGGNDMYFVNNSGDRVIENIGQGTDQVYASVSYALEAGSEIEIMHANAGSTGITLTGNEFNNRIYSGAGNDTLRGLGGNDVYYVNNAADRVLENAAEGTDTVYAAVSYALEAGSEVEILRANAGATGLTLTGNEFANRIFGNSGNDIINGGLGNDILTGGAGQDTFVFNTALNAASNVDRIADFSVVDDTIHLSKSVFAAFASIDPGSVLTAAAFHSAAGAVAAQDAADRIVYNSTNGALYYDADGAGGLAAVRFATLSANLSLTNADFLIIG